MRSIGKKKLALKWPKKDWLVSHTMIDLALDAILKRIKVNREYDIPYLAGYSRDGKTVYIDKDMPKTFLSSNKRIHIDKYLILHEVIEKTLIDQLGLHYQFAHQIALRAEQSAVRADKVAWRDYDKFMQSYIKKLSAKKIIKIPRNLDIKPYHDEHDEELLARMKKI